ncbi:transcriptional regulator, DeoR family [Tessaracoccus bendigoensis DSM 12906]|uniref:Lactose phosphotransferase system repressor n=1 Tax=Tessaracoccus bendigoensis DSM 12906 TaxID=1123357 RepID=A0A1M6MGC2_9ACTN|nr:DeoR/GlpR family DNA-binding transcription regulator [Tessaracoccus bendigoensis]SHJ82515.1 transcriptional regulator, DeoR family [Tessaracoccus bendigoensis DSM 12906]
MLKTLRHDALVGLVQSKGAATVAELAAELGISPATTRRDIIELERLGKLERTWGGVRFPTDVDDPFQEALVRAGAGKARIGLKAAEVIPDGATVILDIGTTAHHVALALRGRDLTVLTASLPTFEVLRGADLESLILLGGRWSEQYQCFTGPQVVDALAHQQADIAFVGCSGVSDTGRVRDTSYSQIDIKRAIRAAAAQTYLLADSQKLPGKGGNSPFELGELDGIITDAQALPTTLAEHCLAHDTEVTLV